MKVTLDHNCLIDLEQRKETGEIIRAIVNTPGIECFVVNIGASERQKNGSRPDHYDPFDQMLRSAGISHLPRLEPMLLFGVTFWGMGLWANASERALASEIATVLFDGALTESTSATLDSPEGRKWLNRTCDVHSLWSHIQNQNDVFLTGDERFMKATKLPKLIALGAKKICRPTDLLSQLKSA